MGVEEGATTPTPEQERWKEIEALLVVRRQFPKGDFETRDRIVAIRRQGFPYINHVARVSPVAFSANMTLTVKDGEPVGEAGAMVPYLFVHESRSHIRLVRSVQTGRRTSYEYVERASAISDADLENIRMGVKGLPELLEIEFSAIAEAGYAQIRRDRMRDSS